MASFGPMMFWVIIPLTHPDLLVQLLLDAGAVELKNAIGILPKALQKKFNRKNSIILQDLAEFSAKEEK